MRIHAVVAFALAMICAGVAQAASVYGAAASLNGSRIVGSPGLTTGDTDWTDAVLSWAIVNNGNGTYDYSYTITGLNRPGGSHFTLDMTDSAISDPGIVTNARLNGGLITIERPGQSGSIDGIFGAIKFDAGADGTLVYTFTSNKVPVYGDFIIKGGSSSTLTNTGFGDQSLMDAGHYIARPDGLSPGPIVPLPAAVWAGMALMGAVAARRVRR